MHALSITKLDRFFRSKGPIRVFLYLLYISPLLVQPWLFSSQARADSIQIAGRIFTGAGPLPGARVQAYHEYEDIVAQDPFRVSPPADKRGYYSLDLPPGQYYFTASGKSGNNHFSAYHGNNPLITGMENLWMTFMAHQVREPEYSDGITSVQGTVTFHGEPVSGAHVAFYTLDAEKFKGLGFLAEKGLGFMKAVRKDGTFDIPLLPNRYVIIARKTEANQVRPLKKGELFCYTPSNPVVVKPDQRVRIELPCYPKADRFAFVQTPKIKSNDFPTIETASQQGDHGIRGKVTDGKGEPVAGAYVIAYRAGDTSSPTREVENIATTDDNGNYFLPLHEEGRYGLVIRDSLGEAPAANGLTGLYDKDPWKGLHFRGTGIIDDINISVTGKDRKLFE